MLYIVCSCLLVIISLFFFVQLWQFLRDCQLYRHKLTIVHIEEIIQPCKGKEEEKEEERKERVTEKETSWGNR